MDDIVRPKEVSDFIGNKVGINSLRKWLQNIKDDPRHSRRVCFLTGPIGMGKSCLAKLVLQECGFAIREFNATDLRKKSGRDLLQQTLGFRDVLALMEKFSKKETSDFRKAVLVDDFENMDQATAEVYRLIKRMIKEKKTKGVPIIFTGKKSFRGKKPLSGNSVFISLKQRSLKEIELVIHQFLDKLIEETGSKRLKAIKKNDITRLSKDCGGDVRRILRYFETLIDVKDESKFVMEVHETRGPLISLYRIMDITKERSLEQILNDLTIEGMTVPFGVHWSYIDYASWYLKDQKKLSHFCVQMSRALADYGRLLDVERTTQFWNLRDIGLIQVGLGFRQYLRQAISKKSENSEKQKNKQDCWWLDLEKGKRPADSNVQTPCMNKTFRAPLNTRNFQLQSFQMITKKVGPVRAWLPATNRRTVELLALRSVDFPGKERLVKLIDKKN